MLKGYEKEMNDLMVEIYDSVQRVEQNMLNNTKLMLSISETDILEVIGRKKEEGCSISEIAHALKVTLPTITVAVKKLESKGFVTKIKSPTDARKLNIVLSAKGRKADAVHRYFHEQAIRACLKDVDESSYGELMKAMKNLNAFLKKHGA